MLRRIFCVFFGVMMVIGYTVVNAAECNHTRIIQKSSEGWVSVGDAFHEYREYYDSICRICGIVDRNVDIKRIEVGQHTLVETYNYHNGDQPEHYFFYYCHICEGVVRRDVACNGNVDGEGCVLFR